MFFDKIFTYYPKKLIKMLIIGKNNENETTKNRGRYSGRCWTRAMTGFSGCPRPELMRKRAIGVELRENSDCVKQLFFGRYNMEELEDSGNGASQWLATRAIVNTMLTRVQIKKQRALPSVFF